MMMSSYSNVTPTEGRPMRANYILSYYMGNLFEGVRCAFKSERWFCCAAFATPASLQYVVEISDHGKGQGMERFDLQSAFRPGVFLIARSWLLYAFTSSLAS